MSQMQSNSGDGADYNYDSDFRRIIRAVMDNFSEFNMEVEVINDHSQLRVVFSPQGIPETEERSLVESITETALDDAKTENLYGVDIFEDDGDYMAVFAPEEPVLV